MKFFLILESEKSKKGRKVDELLGVALWYLFEEKSPRMIRHGNDVFYVFFHKQKLVHFFANFIWRAKITKGADG